MNIENLKNSIPIAMCELDAKGDIINVNEKITDVFLYGDIVGSNIFALMDIKPENLQDYADNNESIILERSEKVFAVTVVSKGEEQGYILYFVDITKREEINKKYEEEKSCIIILEIDNFDQLKSSVEESNQLTLVSTIDKHIRSWAEKQRGLIIDKGDHQYVLVCAQKYCRQIIEEKFKLLDEIREMETSQDFPPTLSIGVGIGASSLEENDTWAQQALDLALGRGGDQAVVKDNDDVMYFGGTTATVEKNNKGKSRVIGSALESLIQTSSRVIVMGHRNPDMDAFGSALAMTRLAKKHNKDTYIVINSYNDALELLYDEAISRGEYKIINGTQAGELIDRKTVLMIIDTHKPSITASPELLEKKCRKVVIDHHRKDKEFIENVALTYIEPYASSSAELVTEILQYTVDKKDITRFEAEALLAGMFVDTNHFSVKSGVRTFEAAAWLRKQGADLANVKKLFQVEKDLFKARVNGVSNAYFDEKGNVYSICDIPNENMQMICSLVAEELLTVKGVDKSFALGSNEKGRTIISARSVGSNNVQVVMEEFGGGGHLNAAAAQTDMSKEEVIEKLKELVG
ncbi:MAG: DHH family phosphoesterase [Eubacteriales bacterium]|nr:DHH family phosphoesterase [Eubacteriales bacterium]MDY3332307.1 DHH family phosphoesterase [Gallibacter sp.]